MAKWELARDATPELEWPATQSPQEVMFLAKPNIEQPWLVDVVIVGSMGHIAFSLHRDDARSLGYLMEGHNWHKGVIGWDEDGVEEAT